MVVVVARPDGSLEGEGKERVALGTDGVESALEGLGVGSKGEGGE